MYPEPKLTTIYSRLLRRYQSSVSSCLAWRSSRSSTWISTSAGPPPADSLPYSQLLPVALLKSNNIQNPNCKQKPENFNSKRESSRFDLIATRFEQTEENRNIKKPNFRWATTFHRLRSFGCKIRMRNEHLVVLLLQQTKNESDFRSWKPVP